MLTLEAIGSAVLRDLRRLPGLARWGLLVFGIGLMTDLSEHLVAGDLADAHAQPTGAELTSHDVVFVGMVLIFVGVVIDGVRRSRARAVQPGAQRKEWRDAVR